VKYVIRSYGAGVLSVRVTSEGDAWAAAEASGFDPVEVVRTGTMSYVMCNSGHKPSVMEAKASEDDEFCDLVKAVDESGSESFRARVSLLQDLLKEAAEQRVPGAER
jgi:hypothetical protein